MNFSGPIYIRLRERMLAFFRDECRAGRQERSNFGEWIRSGAGSFTVTSVTRSEIVIETAQAEVGDVFLRDVEYYTDQCLEHILENVLIASDAQMHSDAWNVVTIYYHAFYAAQSVLRLLGEAVLFFDRVAVSNLVALASATVTPGAGVFIFSQRRSLSATQSEYVFSKVNRRSHEAVWNYLLRLLNDLTRDPALATDAEELEFFRALSTQRLFSVYFDYDWPSKVRYKANYNPGFAYLLMLRKQVAKTKHLIDRWANVLDDDLGRIVHQSSISVILDDQAESFHTHVQLLHDVSMGLFTLSRHLYSDLKRRRRFDARWEDDRKRFFARASIDPDAYPFLLIGT